MSPACRILLVLLLCSCSTLAQPKASTLDLAKAGSDFDIQGEYTGEVLINQEKKRGGAQINALGDGKFKGTFYAGGLPGDGWDRMKDIRHAESRTMNGVVSFVVETYTIQWKDDELQVTETESQAYLGSMKKVQRKSPTLGAKPPEGAVVLFDGTINRFDKPATADHLLPQGVNSREKFDSCTLHLEFLLPFEPRGRGQGRANSGCYLQGRYEVQILDSFGLEGRNNECGGIYTVADPKVNMCYPPLSWQTYDIEFTAAEFDTEGKKTKNARMTVRHNGVLIHENVELPKTTTAAPNRESPEPGALHLQEHGHPVRFRNIWIVPRGK